MNQQLIVQDRIRKIVAIAVVIFLLFGLRLIEIQAIRASGYVKKADVELHGGFAHFDLVTPAGRNSVSLQVMGEHQIPNALAAAAAAFSLGVKNESIAIGLTTAMPSSKWRMRGSNY